MSRVINVFDAFSRLQPVYLDDINSILIKSDDSITLVSVVYDDGSMKNIRYKDIDMARECCGLLYNSINKEGLL